MANKKYGDNRPEADTPAYKAMRYSALSRDSFKCVLCDSNKGLEIHHIKRFCDAEHLRYAVSNVVTLCQNCHELVTGREESYQEEFQRIVAMKKIQKGNFKKENGIGPKRKFTYRPQNPRVR